MALNTTPIQSTFNRYQDPGRVGQLAGRDNGTFIFDTASASAFIRLFPGQGVYALVETPGDLIVWLPAGSPAEEPLVTHIIGYDLTDPSRKFLAFDSTVFYPLSTPGVKGLANGSIYVNLVGVTPVLKYQPVHYDSSSPNDPTNGWVPGFLAGSQSVVIALEDGQPGSVIPVRISRISG